MLSVLFRYSILSLIFTLGLCGVVADDVGAGKNADGTYYLENEFIRAVVAPAGGKLISLIDKRNQREYTTQGGAANGMFRLKIIETPRDTTLYHTEFNLESMVQPGTEAVIMARATATGGAAKDMQLSWRYSLKKGESRLRAALEIAAGHQTGKLSPWIQSEIALPPDATEKRTVNIFGQTRRGLYTGNIVETTQRHNILNDLSEPWIAATGIASSYGIAMVTRADKLDRFYAWTGSPVHFSSEFLAPQANLLDNGVWRTEIDVILGTPGSNVHFAAPEYTGGINGSELTIFPAVTLKAVAIEYSLNGGIAQKLSCGELTAGKLYKFSIAAPSAGYADLRLRLDAGSLHRTHNVRFATERKASEVQAASELWNSSDSGGAKMLFADDTLYLSDAFATPVYFGMSSQLPKSVKNVELILDLPPELQFFPGKLQPDNPVAIQHRGKNYQRYSFTINPRTYYYNVLSMFIGTSLKPGERTEVFYQIRYPGGEQDLQTLPVECVEFQACRRIPRRLLAGFGFCGPGVTDTWPDFFKVQRQIGVNTVSTSGRETDPESLRRLAGQCAANGMRIIANASPTHRVPGLKDDPEAWVAALDGRRFPELCPSYRGKAFRAELDKCTIAAAAGISTVYWDTETWKKAEYCFCERCLEQFKNYFQQHHPGKKPLSPREFEKNPTPYPEYHEAWVLFKLQLGCDFYNALRVGYQQRLRDEGKSSELCQVGFYDVTPGKIYHQFMRYDELTKSGAVDICMPSCYYSGDAKRMADTIRNTRRQVGSSKIIPWLCGGAGADYECDAINLKYMLLETFLNGAYGFTTWPWLGWDALDMRRLAEVMNMVRPLEDIIVDGEVMTDLRVSGTHMRAAGLRLGNDAAILISDYYHETLPEAELTLNVPAAAKLYDVSDRTLLAELHPGKNQVKLGTYGEQARLLAVLQSPPDTDFTCAPQAGAASKSIKHATVAPNSEDRLQIEESAKLLQIGNAYYQLTFRRAIGDLVEIVWRKSGLTLASEALNRNAVSCHAGRLDAKTLKKFTLIKHDSERAELQLEFDFTGDGAITGTAHYTFYAGTPVIDVKTTLRQRESGQIRMPRLNQFSFFNDTARIWHAVVMSSGDRPLASQKGNLKNSGGKPAWSGLSDGTSALAVISGGGQPNAFVNVGNADKIYIIGYLDRNPLAENTLESVQHLYIGSASELPDWAAWRLRQND